MVQTYSKVIFDNIHGYINLNRAEFRVLETPYYQRLRWIRQLGFSFYIFPGATHTRHAHALGVLHVMDRILNSIGKAVPHDRLFNPKVRDEKTMFHRKMRMAALLHDIGTFPFSHTIELAYINHWRKQSQHRKTKHMSNHEVLGSHIIQNTNFNEGITQILLEEGIDPVDLSQTIAGKSQDMLANQLLHSDCDADRMDYLIRDAAHTGVKLGLFDVDFLIRSLTTHSDGKDEYLCVGEGGVNHVDSFLISRYFWYSHIINDGTGYKFDLIAAKIYEYFLENGLAHSFDHLIDQVSQTPNQYFTFNDSYFLTRLNEYLDGRIRHPMIRELCEMLAKRIPPAQIKIAPIIPQLVESLSHRKELVAKTKLAMDWLKSEMEEATPGAWHIFDIPSRDVMFAKNMDSLKASSKGAPLIRDRDAIKILKNGDQPELLVNSANSLVSILSQYRNFIPRVYVSRKTYEKLEKKGVLAKMKTMKF